MKKLILRGLAAAAFAASGAVLAQSAVPRQMSAASPSPVGASQLGYVQAAFRACQADASKPIFRGSTLVLCETERQSYERVALVSWSACKAQAEQPQFLGAEVSLCSSETAAVVESRFLGSWKAFAKSTDLDAQAAAAADALASL